MGRLDSRQRWWQSIAAKPLTCIHEQLHPKWCPLTIFPEFFSYYIVMQNVDFFFPSILRLPYDQWFSDSHSKYSFSLSLSLSPSLSLSIYLTVSLSLSISVSHTHTHTQTRAPSFSIPPSFNHKLWMYLNINSEIYLCCYMLLHVIWALCLLVSGSIVMRVIDF